MEVQEIMTRELVSVEAENPITLAAMEMEKHGVGFLPVLDDDRIVGVVTDRDLVVRGMVRGLDPDVTQVRSVSSPSFVWIEEDQPVKRAAEVMALKRIRRIVVVDGDKKAVGVLSLGDLARNPEACEESPNVLLEMEKGR
jgi:CBS domain-containing protein